MQFHQVNIQYNLPLYKSGLGNNFLLQGPDFAEISNGANFYVNPVLRGNHPDPGALKLPDGSGFVLVSTSDRTTKGQPSLPILLSTNLVNWTLVSYVRKLF